MPNLPSGTVTFVFSDIEGSTALLKRLGDDHYADVLKTHRRIVRETFAKAGSLSAASACARSASEAGHKYPRTTCSS